MINLLSFITIFVFSWLGVGAFQRWSKDRQIVDVPNERSSHERPTPVGGGLVIVLFTIVSMAGYELFTGGIRYWGFYLGGSMIAVVSWIDDIKPLPAIFRFAVHFAAAFIAVFLIGYFADVTIWPGFSLNIGITGFVLTILWIVWMTNAYNFMDGIDGLAGTQAVVASAGWALVSFYTGLDFLLFASIAVMASSFGFLIHNWPPAKVFMGDVGSAFLGFTLAVFPLIAISTSNESLDKGVLPLITVGFVWLFFADSVVTIFRRALKMEKLWDAHRDHLYQSLVKSGRSHLNVTLLYGGLMVIAATFSVLEVYFQRNGLTLIGCLLTFSAVGIVVIISKKGSKK